MGNINSQIKTIQGHQTQKTGGLTGNILKCEKHGEYKTKVFPIGTKMRNLPCPACIEEYESEREKGMLKERIKNFNESIEHRIANSGIPLRHEKSSLYNYVTGNDRNKESAIKTAVSYSKNYHTVANDGSCLVFCGKPGTGKTHIAVGILKYIANINRDKGFAPIIKYSLTYDAIRAVKSTYNPRSEKSELAVIREYISPDMLVLDEVGVQFGTDAEKIIFYNIINGRYENIKPTIVISNLPEKDLIENIGERCFDRLKEGGGVVIPFDWDSYRK